MTAKYTTIRIPDGVALRHVKEFADRAGLLVRYDRGQLILVDPKLPSNVRTLPTRAATAPNLGGAA